jgi:hypothetical protein
MCATDVLDYQALKGIADTIKVLYIDPTTVGSMWSSYHPTIQ